MGRSFDAAVRVGGDLGREGPSDVQWGLGELDVLEGAKGSFPFFGGGEILFGAEVKIREDLVSLGAIRGGVRNDSRVQETRRKFGAVEFEERRKSFALLSPPWAIPPSVLQRFRDVEGAPWAVRVIKKASGLEGFGVPTGSH